MIYIIHKKQILFIAFFLLCVLVFFYIKRHIPVIATPVTNRAVIIDAGHGGGDPGAIGVTGTLEKDINLNSALKLQQFIEQNGGMVIMTRTADEMLAENKREDMKVRKRLREENSGDIFISIHLNSFPQEGCHGAQTFYANNAESKSLAEKIQKNMVKYLDESNSRIAKKLTDVYLLKNVNIPSVIVECGFLSNSKEERLLSDEEYRSKIAFSIYVGIMEYFNEGSILKTEETD